MAQTDNGLATSGTQDKNRYGLAALGTQDINTLA
jgi:hypothetical protein